MGQDVGAAGLQVAHSGDIAGYLFDADIDSLDDRIKDVRTASPRLGMSQTWRYRLGEALAASAQTTAGMRSDN